MTGIPQIGIALGSLGAIIIFMGLFPGVTGITPGRGVGIVQFTVILVGYTLLHLGALIYVKFAFYAGRPSNLAQQVGIRLTLTGLVFGAMAGFADFLGFGSHLRAEGVEVIFGPLQAIGVVGSFFLASLGILIYALTGPPPDTPAFDEDSKPTPSDEPKQRDENGDC